MKRIVAIIQPFKLEDVEEAVLQTGVVGMTVTEVRGFGRQKGLTDKYRGATYSVDFKSKIQVEVVVESEKADPVVEAIEAIMMATRSGNPGDGKIFVEDLIDVIPVRSPLDVSESPARRGEISEGVAAALGR